MLFADWRPSDPWRRLAHATFGGEAVEGESDIVRFKRLAGDISEFVSKQRSMHDSFATMHVYIEQYAFSAARLGKSASLTRLAELGGIVKLRMLDVFNAETQPVTSGQCRKLLLGYGSKKDIKQIAQAEIRLAGAPFKTGDECDAFGVASYGRSELGLPALTLAGAGAQSRSS